jgi:16S rRNA U1498 N3-methylase RsmE
LIRSAKFSLRVTFKNIQPHMFELNSVKFEKVKQKTNKNEKLKHILIFWWLTKWKEFDLVMQQDQHH